MASQTTWRPDWVVAGAGYSGAVIAERLAAELDQQVLVIDRRDHIAGNAYDYLDDHGVLVHQYGPHIFHTSSQKVVDYLSRFTEWTPYEHRVLAEVEGRLVPVPFNLASLRALLPSRLASTIETTLVTRFGMEARVPILKLMDDHDPDIAEFGKFVFANIFEGYTRKQWGLEPSQLSPSVTARVPVAVSEDDRYFQDWFQNMPREGYTAMFHRILGHENIRVALGTSWSDVSAEVGDARLIYTGAIDEFFEYRHGPLPYRSLRFELEATESSTLRQPVGQVNFPNTHAYTRTTEFRHLTGQESRWTTVAVEYPVAHAPGENEPYYPVPRDDNLELHRRYECEAEALAGRVAFVGRLANYRYINMDQAVLRALTAYEREIRPLVVG